MTFKIGMIYRDIVMKQIFLEIHNPYSNKYDEIKDFSYGVIKNIFPNVNNLADMCLFDKTLESLYRKNLVNANNHHELIQYAYLVLKKHVNLK